MVCSRKKKYSRECGSKVSCITLKWGNTMYLLNFFRGPSFKSFNQNYFIFYAVVASIIILSFSTDAFLTETNIMNVLRQSSIISIIAVGSFLVILTAGIDISVGSTVAIVGVTSALLIADYGFNIWLAIFIGIVIGTLVGYLNGVLVAKMLIPAFIATLGTMGVVRGITYVMTDAYPVSNLPESLMIIGRGYIGPIPIPVVIMFVIYIAVYIFIEHTKAGRYIYAIGGNREAAHLSGINVKFYDGLVYVIGGFLAAISGIILLSRLNSGQPNVGLGFEFEAITAAVLGGTSLFGGKGKLFGVFLGALFIAIIGNGMTLLNVSSFYQQIVKGTILVIAVWIDVNQNRKRN
jgi:ribose transport system permease protein